MEKTVTEKSPDTIERKLTRYRNLTERKERLLKWLEKAEKHRGTVNNKIYQKVRAEYDQELSETTSELTPIEREITNERDSARLRLAETEKELDELQEQHAEMTFRHQTGEYDGSKLGEIESSLTPLIHEKKQQKEAFSAFVRRIDETLQGTAQVKGWTNPIAEEVISDLADPDVDASLADPVEDTSPIKPVVDASPADPVAEASPADPPAEASPADPVAKASPADPAMSTSSPNTPESKPAEFEIDIENILEEKKDVPSSKAPVQAEEKRKSARLDENQMIPFPNLIITAGSQSGKKIPLLPMTMTIGREHDNNIEIKDEEVARYHARIVYQDSRFVLQDLNSSTGTWVNGEQITETPLNNNDKIRLGKTEIIIDFS